MLKKFVVAIFVSILALATNARPFHRHYHHHPHFGPAIAGGVVGGIIGSYLYRTTVPATPIVPVVRGRYMLQYNQFGQPCWVWCP